MTNKELKYFVYQACCSGISCDEFNCPFKYKSMVSCREFVDNENTDDIITTFIQYVNKKPIQILHKMLSIKELFGKDAQPDSIYYGDHLEKFFREIIVRTLEIK